jgi:hypothetical protein
MATVECVWGLYDVGGAPRTEPMQKARLCAGCGGDLWKRVKPAVNQGIMHWGNTEVNL